MHIILIITLLIASALSAHARTETLENSPSPNHRYGVQVVEKGTRALIAYDIVRKKGGALLHRFESSYQFEEGELQDRSWNHSTEAEIAWSPDSHYVSIDEQVHRYIGEVLLAEITRQGARSIKLPESAIVAATKRHWDRYRIRSQRGWISADEVSLVLAGKEAESSKYWYFEVVLRIRAGRAFVISCRERPEGA